LLESESIAPTPTPAKSESQTALVHSIQIAYYVFYAYTTDYTLRAPTTNSVR
jgi:hypothetical protein